MLSGLSRMKNSFNKVNKNALNKYMIYVDIFTGENLSSI